MSKSLADNPFITEAKDKNGDSWYHQIILEKKEEEIDGECRKEYGKDKPTTTALGHKFFQSQQK